MGSHRIYERAFPATAESVSFARHFVEGVLGDLSAERFQVAQLLASELATNAIQHSISEFEMMINGFDDRVVIAAMDESPSETAPHSPEQLGWRIVEDIADRSGAEWVPPDSELVWAEINI